MFPIELAVLHELELSLDIPAVLLSNIVLTITLRTLECNDLDIAFLCLRHAISPQVPTTQQESPRPDLNR